MLPGLLVISILLLVLFCLGFVMLYSFYFNSNNKLYHKIKFNYTTWCMLILLIVIFLLLAIILLISYLYDNNSLVRKNFYVVPISFVLFCLSIILFVLMIVIRNKINITRLDITKFRNEDFKTELNKLDKLNHEQILEKKHPRYYSILKQKQNIIESMMKNMSKDTYQSVLTELIMFNETMCSRWSKKNNLVQLKIFYSMCIKLQTFMNE